MRFRSPLPAIAATLLALAVTTPHASGQAARQPMSGDDDKTTGGQIRVLSRQGGEAPRLTTGTGGAGDFRLSPDSTRRRDRLQRYLDWFGKHLRGGTK